MTISSVDAGLVRSADRRLAFIGAVIVALTIAGPGLHRTLGAAALVAVTVASGAGAAIAFHLSARVSERRGLWIVLLAAAVMRLSLLFFDNYLSSDLFRYIWDGRVQAAGINPYRYVPAAPELAFLHTKRAHAWPPAKGKRVLRVRRQHDQTEQPGRHPAFLQSMGRAVT
jgi:hypothetical protein